jgi:hypothetical protein
MRTFDIEKVVAATQDYETEGFHPSEWLSHDGNIALINDNEDIALFEEQSDLAPGTVCGHYFFFSRGKQAVKAAENFLEEIFSEPEYSVKTIMGLTPTDHKGALWMNKRLGFKEHGTVDTVIGPCKFVLMTKEQWKDRQQ